MSMSRLIEINQRFIRNFQTYLFIKFTRLKELSILLTTIYVKNIDRTQMGRDIFSNIINVPLDSFHAKQWISNFLRILLIRHESSDVFDFRVNSNKINCIR